MSVSTQRWLRGVFLATALVFTGVAVYVYAFRFFDWLESDASVAVLLAAKAIRARSPIVDDWYYANGDLWGLAPHLFAIPPVAILGIGPASLLISVVIGFVLELVVFVKLYLRLSGERWVAIFATMATLMAWSSAHVDYEYIQLAYGFVSCLYLLLFSQVATLAEDRPPRRWWFAAAGLFVALLAVQNPMRGLVYVLAPIVAASLWPWRAVAARRRLAIAAVAVAGWGLAYVLYTWVLARLVQFSLPRGHFELSIGGATRIKANLAMLGRGLATLCGGGAQPTVWAIPGAVILGGALALVCREALASRAFTTLRFLAVIVLAQIGIVLVPLLISNLLTDPVSVRYLMPSTLIMIGLGVVIAVRTAGEAGPGWARRLSIGWLTAIPLAALAAAPAARPPAPQLYVRPDPAELVLVADELVRRELTHGFAINLGANLLRLDSRGAAMTCPIYFRDIILPQRWLTDTWCFTASAIPERFFIVGEQTEHVRKALRATLPPELERFSVGDTYDVYIYRKTEAAVAWLELPIPDGERATFPLRLPATHLQLIRANAALEGGELVATGEQGTVVYGPYIELPKGRYEVSWIGTGTDSPGQISFIINSGSKRLAQTTVVDAKTLPRQRTELIRIPFTVGRRRTGIEFPIESGGGGRVSLHELVIEKR